jgi:transmembrane protein TMEM260 (protein O-mannosyltransferase)
MTGLLLPSERLIADPGERVQAQPTAPGRSRLSRLLTAWPYIVPLLVLSLVYGRTVQRSTGNDFSVDTTKFDYLGLVLGTAHPPGYPLYTMLNAAFVRIVPWGSVAFRANLLSAVFAVFACLVAVSIFTTLGVRPVLAAGGATALGLIPQLWHFALVAEVYTLSILLVALVLACLLGYDRTRRPAWLRAGLLIFALSFAHATSQVLLIPGLLLYLGVRRPAWLFRPRELARLLPLGAALALLPYAYLVWRTAAGAPLLDTRVTDFTSFWEVISGARYSGQMFGVPLHEIVSERLPQLWSDGIRQLGIALLVCAIGLLVLIMQRPLAAAVTGLWLMCTTVFALGYAIGDWETTLLPLWFLLGLWGVVGINRCVAGLSSRAGWVPVLIAITLPVVALASGYAEADRSSLDPQADVDAALRVVPDNSIIFTYDNGTRHQFWYRLLPGGVGTRRNVWAAMGVNPRDRSDRAGQILQYCANSSGPWIWSDQEKAAGPGVPRGLKTYVFGSTYMKQVQRSGLRVTGYSGQLFSLSCPS